MYGGVGNSYVQGVDYKVQDSSQGRISDLRSMSKMTRPRISILAASMGFYSTHRQLGVGGCGTAGRSLSDQE